MIDQQQRREHFLMAVELLGGQRPTARILKITDRAVRNLCSGATEIRAGFMRDITDALDKRARACVALARITDPLFTANLTAAEVKALPKPKRENTRG